MGGGIKTENTNLYELNLVVSFSDHHLTHFLSVFQCFPTLLVKCLFINKTFCVATFVCRVLCGFFI